LEVGQAEFLALSFKPGQNMCSEEWSIGRIFQGLWACNYSIICPVNNVPNVLDHVPASPTHSTTPNTYLALMALFDYLFN
jgi:hypothetical protein